MDSRVWVPVRMQATLRATLHADPEMDRLLRQLRQLLDYEPMEGTAPRSFGTAAEAHTYALPLLQQLSAEVDVISGNWWGRDFVAHPPA